MKRALWLLAASLPLAGQPKLLVNAQVDTRPVPAGLDQEVRKLIATAARPVWIGYSVPASRTARLGCGSPPGVAHLEPPEQTVILFRAEANAVEQIRALSADCEIDAGGVQVHWLTGVKPSESVALLAAFAMDRDSRLQRQAISALTEVSEGVPALIQLVKSAPDAAVRRQVMNSLQQSRDPRASAFFEDVLRH
jgi:HEAT repeat protein